jgi:O-antigen ligase
VHNNVLKLLYEAGVPAVVGLLLLWLVAARQGWRLLLNTRGTSLHPLVLALLGSFVTATVFAQFHPLAYERYYWFPLVMIGATWSLRRHELKTAAVPA